jgi:hypothetical protein
LLALLLRGLRLDGRAASRVACSLIGAGFCVLKLSPAVAAGYDAALTRAAAAIGLAITVQTRVDPTDLMALAVLPVALVIGVRMRPARGLLGRGLLAFASLCCLGTSPSHWRTAPHWGFATPVSDRMVVPFCGGMLDVRFGRVSAEGSFELAVGAYAQAEPLAVELSQIRAWLAGDRVTATLDGGVEPALVVPPQGAASARVYFRLRGFEVPADSDYEEAQKAHGVLAVPVRIGERHHVVRLQLSFEPRLLAFYGDSGRFGGGHRLPGEPIDPWKSEQP